MHRNSGWIVGSLLPSLAEGGLLKSKFQQEHQRPAESYDAIHTSLPTNRFRISTSNSEYLQTEFVTAVWSSCLLCPPKADLACACPHTDCRATSACDLFLAAGTNHRTSRLPSAFVAARNLH